MFDAFPIRGCRLRLGMESRFSVEARSFCFSVMKGLVELWAEEKREGVLGVALLGVEMDCLTAVNGGRGVEKSWDRGFRQIL